MDHATLDRVAKAMHRALAGFVAGLVITTSPMALGESRTAATGQPGSQTERLDYERARWDPIHFKPQIDSATDEQCLECHRPILERRVLTMSPAGLPADATLAWYQTLDTYTGPQETFHRRHMVTPLAQRLMNMRCNTCHQGHDPREEAVIPPDQEADAFALRKSISPQTCLMCHGQFPAQLMGLTGPWEESGKVFGYNCLTCHAAIRHVRHEVNYLNAGEIEVAGRESSDSCYGCHGGRSWYQISYPYPRHAWPGMSPTTPEWAASRPTESEARFLSDGAGNE